MKAHILTEETLMFRGTSEPHVEIIDGSIWIVCGSQVRMPLVRNAREVAFMLCEAADELERKRWHDREREWKVGK
jgi:hypothetical protein